MTSLPDFDPYEVLGVARDATLAEIKSSHRKLVLKCHPDKIKDESLRSQAQDQFQKVQQAYEVLSDETTRTKYDNKVKLAELKREMMARGASFSRPSPREYRDGRYYEERVPADARSSAEAFFEDESRFTEPPRPMSRKTEEYGTRPRSRAADEKKKSSKGVSSSAARAAKEARESTKASRADRDKYRTKERRRQAYEKRVYPDSDTYDSDSDGSEIYYIPVKRPSEHKRHRDPKPKSTSSGRRSETRRRDASDDEFSDEREYKHDIQYSSARDYIRRSKETILESDRRHRSSRSPLRYDSGEPELSSRRSKRSSRESARPPTSRHGSYEHLEPSRPRVHEKIPSMPSSATFPGPNGPSSPRPSHQPSRSSTSVRSQSRSNRESSRRPEAVHLYPDASSRTTKLRGEKSDSGYASSSPTPEAAEASPKSSRYKNRPEPVIVEPSSTHGTPPPPLRPSRTFSPTRQERRVPVRSSTYAYPPEASSRRPPLYREVEMDSHIKEELKYAREVKADVTYIRPSHAHAPPYRDDYPHPMGRRQSTPAY
ncbi:J domain-containing protein [Aspergillus lucknowensis]|uniref:J domain-containing protein n=1 Tax=Aspergillus lucknowensis TaxID=176173 RepID=A0ABR4LQ76_9EURO